MARRVEWILVTALFAGVWLGQPWSNGAAQAGPGPRPTLAVATACRDTRAQLVDAQAEIEQLQAERAQLQGRLAAMVDAERARARKLAEQLGSALIENLH